MDGIPTTSGNSRGIRGAGDTGVVASKSRIGELGRPANIGLFYSSRGDKAWTPVFSDPNPVLQFPFSVQVYSVMSRTDEQVDSVMRSVSLPIIDAPWSLEDKGVRPEVVQFVRDEIGLPVVGEALRNRQRGQSGIVFADHITEALDALTYGFMPFEQVVEVTFPGDEGHPEGAAFASQPAVHLRKLAARHPATIRRILLNKDGGLASIVQVPTPGEPDQVQLDGQLGIEITVDRLVMYVNDRKGADWSGVSILRSAYRPWKVKEQFVRLDAIAAERNSLGIPVIHYDPTTMTEDAALELATSARSGAEAGMALPAGVVSFELVGVTGTVPDLGPKIAQYNEMIGRASLAMFLNLGHDNGARSLGDTFLGMFTRAVQTKAGQFARTFTEHVIRDLVEWNFGQSEPYPRLTPGEITTEMALTPEGLATLIKANVLVPDAALETQVRRRFRLPPAEEDSKRIPADPKSRFPFQPTSEPNPLDPSVTAPGGPTPSGPTPPAAPVKPPAAAPPVTPAAPAAGNPYVPVKITASEARSTAGYAAYLAGQVAELTRPAEPEGSWQGGWFKFNPNQPRDAEGQWGAGGGGGTAVMDRARVITRASLSNPDTPRTRAVGREEFQSLADVGTRKLAAFRDGATPPAGLDQHWGSVKDQGWSAVQSEWGGLTVDSHTGKALAGNEEKFALSVKPPTLDSVSIPIGSSRREFDGAMETARTRFRSELSNQQHSLGIFRDEDVGRIDIDPVLVVDSHADAESIGVATHAVGGAYKFSDGNGYWPPYIADAHLSAEGAWDA